MSNLNRREKSWKPDPHKPWRLILRTFVIKSSMELSVLDGGQNTWDWKFVWWNLYINIIPISPQSPSLVWRQVLALVLFALFYVASQSSKIFYAWSLFCHNRFLVFSSHQDYYPLFSLLKNTTHKWADIFSALFCPSRASHSHSTLSHSTHKHQPLLCLPLCVLQGPLYLLTKGN